MKEQVSASAQKWLRSFVKAVLWTGAGVFSGIQGVSAQSWADKPIKIVVPYPAGSTPDSLARIISDGLAKRINRAVTVENRPGGGGMIGAKFVSDSVPDGSTLLMYTSAWSAAKIINKQPLVSVPDGLEPVTLAAEGAFALTSSGAFAPRTFDEFARYAKENPGRVNYATTGQGDNFLYEHLIQKEKGFKMEAIQYKGSSEYVAALVSNDVQVAITPQYTMLPFVKDGRMRILAVSGNSRSKVYPDAPTFQELGIPQIRNNWFAMFAPRGTSAALIQKINSDVVAVIRSPEASRKIQDIYFEPVGSSAEVMQQRIATDIAEWTDLARAVGIKPQ